MVIAFSSRNIQCTLSSLLFEKTDSLGQNHHNKISSHVSNSLSVVISNITPKSSSRKNSILYDFLWDSKGDKIEGRTEIINDYDKDGLKMIDIQCSHQAAALRDSRKKN